MGRFSKRTVGHVATSERVMHKQIKAMARRGYAVQSATVRRGSGFLGRFGTKSRCTVIYQRSLGQ